MLKIKHVPEQLFDVTAFPIMFTLMFTYLFGGALAGSPERVPPVFCCPGILVHDARHVITMYTGVGAQHRHRRRASPTASGRCRSGGRPPLVGTLLGDAVRYMVAAVVVIMVGAGRSGFRPDGGAAGVVAGDGAPLVFAFALSWVWTASGCCCARREAVMSVSMMVLFPLTFLSNVFVDPETMPGWLEAFVNVNPISVLVTACRGLMAGSPDGTDIMIVLAVAAGLIAVFAPITSRLYRRPA